MPESLQYRVVTILVLFAVLAGRFVLAGALEPSPDDNSYPSTDDLATGTDQYVGDRVTVSGTVTSRTPLTVETQVPGGTLSFTVDGTDRTVPVGDHLVVHGTLRDGNRIDATGTVHHESWQLSSMYIVSFFAGLLVLVRLGNHWRVDTEGWTVVPRTEPW